MPHRFNRSLENSDPRPFLGLGNGPRSRSAGWIRFPVERFAPAMILIIAATTGIAGVVHNWNLPPWTKALLDAMLFLLYLLFLALALCFWMGVTPRDMFSRFIGKAKDTKVARPERFHLAWFLFVLGFELLSFFFVLASFGTVGALFAFGIWHGGLIASALCLIITACFFIRRYRNEKNYWELQVLHADLALRTVQELPPGPNAQERDAIIKRVLKHCIDAIQSGKTRRAWGGWRGALFIPVSEALAAHLGVAAPGRDAPSTKYLSGDGEGQHNTLAWKAWCGDRSFVSQWAPLDRRVDQNYSQYQSDDHPFVIRSIACCPVYVRGQRVAVLSIDHNWPMMIKSADAAVLSYYCQLLGVVLRGSSVNV